MVLSASSPLLRRVLLEALEVTTNSEEPVNLPDFSVIEVVYLQIFFDMNNDPTSLAKFHFRGDASMWEVWEVLPV